MFLKEFTTITGAKKTFTYFKLKQNKQVKRFFQVHEKPIKENFLHKWKLMHETEVGIF